MTAMKHQRIIIIGGVAGGASCAARLRRLNEHAEITLFERGPYASFANCGLPYRLGNVIGSDEDLLVAKPTVFTDRFRIALKTRHEVKEIDRAAKMVRGVVLETGQPFEEPYDALVLSPGAQPVRPPLPGIDLPGIFTVRSIPDIQAIRAWVQKQVARRAVVVGGGFIGLETAENLRHLGMEVTVIEMLDQIMPPLDADVVRPIEDHLRDEHGIHLALGDGVADFQAATGGGIVVRTRSGATHQGDLVILSIGVRPETTLAKAAGLEIGERGGIRVDARMRTSDPAIYAVGDAVEVESVLDGKPTLLALAGPANRQGRIAADAIAGRDGAFRGVQGTSIVGVFDMAVGGTGWTEKALLRAGVQEYAVEWLHPGHHAGYYPGATALHIKVIYRKSDGRLLGAQVAGRNDVARKVDVFAAFLQMEATVFDLAQAELAYSPQFGSAKDAVNLAGMIASNALRGDTRSIAPGTALPEAALVVDVREPNEFARGHLPGAIHIPLGQLRARAGELPADRPVVVYCQTGKRGHDAERLLQGLGFDAWNLSGGWVSWRRSGLCTAPASPAAGATAVARAGSAVQKTA